MPESQITRYTFQRPRRPLQRICLGGHPRCPSIKLTEIGWDVRTDGHCGAGAPRFNVVTSDSVTHFIGCSSPAPISRTMINDRRGKTWERRRYDPQTAFSPILPTTTVKSITIVFDEGTDQGEGFAYVDNVDINGALIGRPGITKSK